MNPNYSLIITSSKKINKINYSNDLNISNETPIEKRNEYPEKTQINEIFENKHFKELITNFKIDLNPNEIIEDDYLKLNSELSKSNKKLLRTLINKTILPIIEEDKNESKDILEAIDSKHINQSKLNSSVRSKETSSIFFIEDFTKSHTLLRPNSNKIIKFGQQKFFKKRKTQKFKNICESFDSSMEEKEYCYEDYMPKLLSIDKNSRSYNIWRLIRQNLMFFAIIYYSFLFSIQSIDDRIYYLFVFISILLEVFLITNFILRYFLIPYHDSFINKPKYDYLSVFKYRVKRNILGFVIDLISVFPLIILTTIYKLVLIEEINTATLDNIELQGIKFKISYIFKSLLIYNLRKWIQISSIFESKNKKIVKNKAESESNDGFIFVVMKIFLFFYLLVMFVLVFGLELLDTMIVMLIG